ncbi:MAG: type II toxin-antitoxin system RelE/ParE family toxin [Acinetobacter sp.]|nr:MAG: type II toxin-antitoxin system RelE/ParE family toxin [Acinetobacter sp.]
MILISLIYNYIADKDSLSRADDIWGHILLLVEDLSYFSQRGSHPKELLALGIYDYRQVFVYDYRLIYRIVEQEVLIYFVVDG